MTIQFGCQCGQAMTVRDEFAGKQLRCPKCQAVLSVPVVAAPSSNPTSTAPAIEGLPPVQPPDAMGSTPTPTPSATPSIDVSNLPPVQAWSFPRATDFTLVALTADAIWVGDKNEVDLPKLTSYLNGGGDPRPIFAERGLMIPLQTLNHAEANKHGNAVDIQYQPSDQAATSHLDFANQADRNVFFTSLQARLGGAFQLETEQVSSWHAARAPLLCAAFAVFITILFYLGTKDLVTGESEADLRGRKQFLKLIVYWVANAIGPNGVLIVGALVVTACVVWFVMRAQQPPVLVRLKRAA